MQATIATTRRDSQFKELACEWSGVRVRSPLHRETHNFGSAVFLQEGSLTRHAASPYRQKSELRTKRERPKEAGGSFLILRVAPF